MQWRAGSVCAEASGLWYAFEEIIRWIGVSALTFYGFNSENKPVRLPVKATELFERTNAWHKASMRHQRLANMPGIAYS